MNGISTGGKVTLFLGHLPGRKGMAFYFQDGGTIYPVAFVAEKHEKMASEYWERLLDPLKEEK